jgi:hypothetical protein
VDLDEVDGVLGDHRPALPAFQNLFDVGVRHAGSADREGVAVLAPLDR